MLLLLDLIGYVIIRMAWPILLLLILLLEDDLVLVLLFRCCFFASAAENIVIAVVNVAVVNGIRIRGCAVCVYTIV